MRAGSQQLPTGTVTFLFTDIERSTQSAEELGDERWADVLEFHRDLLRPVFAQHRGIEVGTEGDAFFVAFASAADAVAAAVEGQRAVSSGSEVRVRIGMHTGEALVRGSDYIGHDVHKAKRVSDAGHGGQILLSQTTADLVRDKIALVDLGPHRLKDLGEPQRLFQAGEEKFPPLRTLDTARHNLAVQLTSFVGREKELEEARALLERTRLLTITGAGGCGKTRLALQLGAEVVSEFVHGVWLVDLAPQTDPAVVVQRVADAVRVPQGHADDLTAIAPIEERLIEHLRDRAVLIILDNCEHLIGASAEVVLLLLRNCPDVRIVVTTREPLGVPGETSWRLPSLDVPVESTPDALAGAEATRLFVERATQTLPTFEPTADDGRAIVDICTRLDGIPLAIELAAARVRVLPCPEIAKRLDDRFRLLTGGSRTAMPRQQTLRATVDWSHDLLSMEQKALLRRLSVFAGGFTLEGAESICTDEIVPVEDVLDHVTALVDRSLVLAQQGEGGRYKLLDTVRHYAREKLVDSGEGPVFRRRHMDHFLGVAEAASRGLVGRDTRIWVERLTEDLENLRQAFDWAIGEDPGSALKLVGSLQEFWGMSMRMSEGRRWAEAALAASDAAPSSDRVRAMRVAIMGRPDREKTQEAVDLARSIGDKRQVAELLEFRARGAGSLGHADMAVTYATEALELAEQVSDMSIAARCHLALGTAAARTGDMTGRLQHLERSLELFRSAGDLHGEALVAANLGQTARFTGNYGEAEAHLRRQLDLAHEIGCRGCLANSQLTLGWLARGRKEYAEAVKLTRNAIRIQHEDRMEFFLYFSIGTLAMVAHDHADDERAARLFGVTDALRKRGRMDLGPQQAEAEQRRVAQVREALGDDAFNAAFASGQAMSLDDAVAYALED